MRWSPITPARVGRRRVSSGSTSSSKGVVAPPRPCILRTPNDLPVNRRIPPELADAVGRGPAGSLGRQEQVAVETEEVVAPEAGQIGRPRLRLGLGHAAMARDEPGDELDHPCAE